VQTPDRTRDRIGDSRHGSDGDARGRTGAGGDAGLIPVEEEKARKIGRLIGKVL